VFGSLVNENGTYIIRYTATECGNTEDMDRTVTIDDSPPTIYVIGDATVGCLTITVPTATANDTCDGNRTVLVSSYIESEDNCSTVTVYAFEACDTKGQCTYENFTQTVIHDEELVWDCDFPYSATEFYECVGDPWVMGAFDGCDNTIHYFADRLSTQFNDFNDTGVTQYDYSVSDYCGHTLTWSYNETVYDTTPPTWNTTSVNTTGECNATDYEEPVAHDNCKVVDITSSVTTDIGVCNSEITTTYMATDANGNTALTTVSAIQTISDYTPPLINHISVTEDGISSDVTFSYANLAEVTGGQIPTNCIAIFLTPSNSFVAYSITALALSECETHPTCNVVHTLSDQQHTLYSCPRNIQWTPQPNTNTLNYVASEISASYTGDCNSIYNFTANATDNCDGPISPVPLSRSGDVISFTATDACGNSDTVNLTLTFTDTTPPYVPFPPSQVNLTQGECAPEKAPNATDDCAVVNVTMSEDEDRVCGTGCYGNYTLYRYFSATDGTNTVSNTTTYYSSDTTPPVFYGLPLDGTEEAPASGADYFDPTVVTAIDYPSGTYTNVSHSITEHRNPNCTSIGFDVITFTTEDACGNSNTKDATLFIVDTTPPVFTHKPDNVTIECDSVAPDCNVETIEGLPVQTSYNNMNASMSTVQYFAIDCAGNTVTHTQTIHKIDSTPPVFTRTPDHETAACDCGALPAPTLAAVDNCEDNIQVSYQESQLTVSGVAADAYPQILVREWTATDGNNSMLHTQTVTLEDNDAPDIILNGQISNAATDAMGPQSCDAVALLIPSLLNDALAQDNCDMSPQLSTAHEYSVYNGSVPDCSATEESHTVTLVASDVSGNSRTSVISFLKLDMSSPSFATLPSPLPAQCPVDGTPTDAQLQAALSAFVSDDCSESLVLAFSNLNAEQNTFSATITDACGKTSQVHNAEYNCVGSD